MFHVKTAGLSYLEALRVIARLDPSLFRAKVALARERYREERVSYHVSASAERIPDPVTVSDGDLSMLLDQSDARQELHITYGSALDRYGAEMDAILGVHTRDYVDALEHMLYRHLDPLTHVWDQSGAGK